MRIVGAVGTGALGGAIVAVLIAWALGIAPGVRVEAADSRSVHVEAFTLVTSGKPGDACAPFGLIDKGRTLHPTWRQLIVTDAAGAIVGAVDLHTATVAERGPDLACVVTADVVMPDAPFYTFTVDGAYRLTVSRASLEAAGWTHEAFMGSGD